MFVSKQQSSKMVSRPVDTHSQLVENVWISGKNKGDSLKQLPVLTHSSTRLALVLVRRV